MTYLTPQQRNNALRIMLSIEEPKLQKEVSFRLFRDLVMRAARNFELTTLGVSEMMVVSRAQAIVDQIVSDWIMTLTCQNLFDVGLLRVTVTLAPHGILLCSSPELVEMGRGKSQIKLFRPPNWLAMGQHVLISDWLEYERSVEFDLQREAYSQLLEMIDEKLPRQTPVYPVIEKGKKAQIAKSVYEQAAANWKKLHFNIVGLDNPDISIAGVYNEDLDYIQAVPSFEMRAISAGGSRLVSFMRAVYPPVI